MKKTIILWALFLTLGANLSCEKKSGETIVRVNDAKITQGDLDLLSKINPAIATQINSPLGRKQFIDNLVEQELLYQASKKNNVDNDPLVKEKIALYKKVIIAQGYLDQKMEEEAKKYYEQNKNEFEQLQMSHIMIRYQTPADPKNKPAPAEKNALKRTEAQALQLANKIRKQLDAEGDFEKLAKEVSEDKSTNTRGGDLGTISRNDRRMERMGWMPLAEKAFEMKVGEMAGPFKTDRGYHIIKLTQPAELKSFDEVREYLFRKLRNQIRQTVVAELKEKGKIEYAGKEGRAAPTEGLTPSEKTNPTEPSATEPATAEPAHGEEGHNHDHPH